MRALLPITEGEVCHLHAASRMARVGSSPASGKPTES